MTTTTFTPGQTITLYSGIRGAETATIDSVENGVVGYHFGAEERVHYSYVTVLAEGMNPALAKAGNAIEMRRSF